MPRMNRWSLLLLACVAGAALAQPNGILLVAQPGARMRLYAGFSGWAPRQLEAEMASGSWYVLRATEELVFRKDTTGMWRELVERARGSRVARDPATFVAAR